MKISNTVLVDVLLGVRYQQQDDIADDPDDRPAPLAVLNVLLSGDMQGICGTHLRVRDDN